MKLLSRKKKGTAPSCHGGSDAEIDGMPKIVIVGNPNVGKSLVFNRLTGAYVTVSNYPGTTVSLDTGICEIDGRSYGVTDSPGMYSLTPITEEERVAKLLLLESQPQIVLHVVDAKNLERMLHLTIQLIEADFPVILVANMMDEAEEAGIKIDFEALEVKLGIPVVQMIATIGKGYEDLIQKIREFTFTKGIRIEYPANIDTSVTDIESLLRGTYSMSKRSVSLLLLQGDTDTMNIVGKAEGERIREIQKITESIAGEYGQPLNYIIKMRLQREVSRIVSSVVATTPSEEMSFKEKLSRAMIRPITGIPILIAVLFFGVYLVVGVFGAGVLVDLIEGTLFGEMINPAVTDFVNTNVPYEPIQKLLVGDYGIMPLGITYAIAIILPIVGTFFLVFSIIEDSGYLPRLALLTDRVFKKIGLSGRAVLPLIIGLGCDTMATVVTRTQETKRERVISTLLLALAIPCSAQLGVILAILSDRPAALLIWFIVILLNFLLIGFLASKILPGDKPSFYMELPPLRRPKLSNVLTKTYSKMVWYFKEILPFFLLASVIIWIFDLVGLFQIIINGLNPVVNLLGLPDDTSPIFLFGFFRRDYGAAGLYDIRATLTGVQLVVAAVTLTLFVPCIAQFMIMIKERGVGTAIAIFVFVMFFAFFVGFVLNHILTLLGVTI